MSETFLGRLGRKLGALTASPLSGRIEKHFMALGESQSGLPAQIASYVLEGQNSSVLSSLATPKLQKAWRDRWLTALPGNRPNLFAPGADWSPAQMKRLGEVLATLEPLQQHGWGYCGTKKSPDWLRHAVTEWLGDKKESPDRLAGIAAEGGLGTLPVLDVLFHGVERFSDIGGWLARNAEAVTRVANELGADERAGFATAVGRFGLVDRYLELIVDLASNSSRKVRTAARQALTGVDADALRNSLAIRYTEAASALRVELIEVAAAGLGERARGLLEVWKADETAAGPTAAIDRALVAISPTDAGQSDTPMDGPAGYRASDGSFVELPARPPAPEASAIPAELFKLLEPVAAAHNAKNLEGVWQMPGLVDAGHLERLKKLAEDHRPISKKQETEAMWLHAHKGLQPDGSAFFDDERLSLWHSVRFAVASTYGNFDMIEGSHFGPPAAALARRIAQGADIRVVLELWTRFGGRDPFVEHLAWKWRNSLAEMGTVLWPALCERFDVVDEALGMKPQSGARTFSAQAALELLALFPKLPRRYHQALMMLAGGTARETRNLARTLLRDTPDIEDAIVKLLGDGKQDMRAGAADWLAQRNARGKIAALRGALKKERSELARAAMITALERLGDDISDFFNGEAMVREAEAGLAKTKVPALDWFPLGHLPALRWHDGTPVDPRLPRWWLTLAAKLKQPGGSALFDLWLDRLASGDAHRLGWMVLVGWIGKDTRGCTVDEANAYAVANVASALRSNASWARQYPESAHLFSTDRNVVLEQLKREKLGEYLDSAADSKGILALCTRVDGAEAAQQVRAFLKDHGSRVSQAKALLDMLAGNPSKAALQVVLAAARRTKQRSVQEHAGTLVGAIAERRGWSTEELADRTIPTGGFDGDGMLELECGRDRIYSMRLGEADSIILLNAEGKEVKALPAPRLDEEKPVIDAAKKLVSTARKEVKQVFAAQRERLHEAMCLGRQWKGEDWETFIARHPLVGRLAQRLIWIGLDDGGRLRGIFRPLEDGSYTNAADEAVDLAAFAHVQLAHRSLLDTESIGAWQRHLVDYEVAVPFDQIGRELPVLPDRQQSAHEIRECEGWMIETFKLRGAATKLGYVRGSAIDGGMFMTYERPYRAAGILAELEFTGSSLPEKNVPAALTTLSFRRIRSGSDYGPSIELAKVPPVLLAECWQDLRDIAAKGSGFDPDWRNKAHG